MSIQLYILEIRTNYLIMLYCPFYILLNLIWFANIFKDFFTYVYEKYWSIIFPSPIPHFFPSVISFAGLGIRVMLAPKRSWEVFPPLQFSIRIHIRLMLLLPQRFDRFHQWNHGSGAFFVKCLLFFSFLGPHLWHTEVLRLWVK